MRWSFASVLLIAAATIGMASANESSPSIDTTNVTDYASATLPNHVAVAVADSAPAINNRYATLGRVLFYDKKLATNHTVACASCHQQAFAFGDPRRLSAGVGGDTARQSMRLINLSYGRERRLFWDERASSLEVQIAQPIRSHIELGFSGTENRAHFVDLLERLRGTNYYPDLFAFAFGDEQIDERRLITAIAHFVRSIVSFDAKYDDARAEVGSALQDFPAFTPDENAGKRLFMLEPEFNDHGSRIGGGAGCAQCHTPPLFDIDPDSGNNGVVGASDGTTDISVTRAPSLRDIVGPDGHLNAPLTHLGVVTDLGGIIKHYNTVVKKTFNNNIDARLVVGGETRALNLTEPEKAQLALFLATLTGKNVYRDPKWSDPFTATDE